MPDVTTENVLSLTIHLPLQVEHKDQQGLESNS